MKQYLTLLLLLVLTFAISCSRDNHNHDHENEHDDHEMHDHDHGHDHEHEEVSQLITAYSDNFELFADADPFVAGQESEILAHFTRLSDFSPLSNANVSMKALLNGQSSGSENARPVSPGIYSIGYTPATSGLVQFEFTIDQQGKTFSVLSEMIDVFEDEHDALHTLESSMEEPPDAMNFTKEQQWKINFSSGMVELMPFSQSIKSTAEIVPMPGDEILIVAGTHGNVSFLSSSIMKGYSVFANQNLVNISGESLAENNTAARYTKARNDYEASKADYERAQLLAKDQIVSEKELLDAKNRYQNAKVVFENLDNNFATRGQLIKSPATGHIHEVYIQNGQHVQIGDPLFSIRRNEEMMLRASVAAKYAGILDKLTTAHIIFDDGKSYTLDELGGSILSHAHGSDRFERLLPVHMSFKNTENRAPGSMADVYLKTTDTDNSIVIPNSAIIEEQENYSVLVQLHPELFEKRSVKRGKTDGMFTEITSGLSEGERIVTEGAVMVKIAAATGAVDPHSGHHH